jgi:two-component system sensor histidine kinase YesM
MKFNKSNTLFKNIWNKKLWRLKLRDKLSLVYAAIVVVLIVSVGYLSFKASIPYMEEQTTKAYVDVLSQASSSVEYIIENHERALYTLYTNQSFQDLLNKCYIDNYDQYETSHDIQIILNSMLNGYDQIPQISIYMSDTADPIPPVKSINSLTDKKWVNLVLSKKTGIVWDFETVNNNGISQIFLRAAKALPNNSSGKPPGIMCIEMDSYMLFNNLSNPEVFKNGNFYLLDSEGKILFNNNLKKIGKNFHSETGIDFLLMNKSTGSFLLQTGKSTQNVIYKKENEYGYTLVGFAPIKESMSIPNRVGSYLIWLTVIFIVTGIIIICITSFFFTKRISAMTEKLKKVAGGDFNISIDAKGYDEIGEMSRAFADMTHRMQHNIDEIAEIKMRELNLKFKLLQAQINPHFLYNTLSTIRWMAIDINAENISNALEELSKYYRVCLSKGQDVIPVRNELEQIKSYIYIQNIMLNNKIRFIFHVNKKALDYNTPKMILQPIVENAIYHGIESIKKEGVIHIGINLENGDIVITVEDDGAGIEAQCAKALLSGEIESTGYGLKNINERVHLLYGDCYGISITSHPGKGTLICIRIPATSSQQINPEDALC